MDLLYNILMLTAAVVGLPFFAFRFIRERRFRERLRQNLGFFPAETLTRVVGRSPVWFQAASVGEVVAASSTFVSAAGQNSAIAAIQPGFYKVRTEIPAADAVSMMAGEGH